MPLPLSARHKVAYDAGGGIITLRINDSRPEDSGVYTVVCYYQTLFGFLIPKFRLLKILKGMYKQLLVLMFMKHRVLMKHRMFNPMHLNILKNNPLLFVRLKGDESRIHQIYNKNQRKF
jgi:hypothetical protein